MWGRWGRRRFLNFLNYFILTLSAGRWVWWEVCYNVSCIIDFEIEHNCDSYLTFSFQHYLHTRGTTVYNLTTGRLVHISMPSSLCFRGRGGAGAGRALLFCLLSNFVNFFKILLLRRGIGKGKMSVLFALLYESLCILLKELDYSDTIFWQR